ncbi:YybH family protein [Pseudoduganella sp. RAF53_2]|uniref:YybH family protein n=1 Tax=unclassified Pseudoduganella TaxID=2637179 RepID=UPI003F99494E
MEADERAVCEVHATWIKAVNAGDLACLLTLLMDDAVLIGPGQAPIGKNEFSANLPAAHQKNFIDCVSELEEVVVAGDVAYTRARDSLTISPRAGGDTMRFAGYRMTVYRKLQGGRWHLARDAHTLQEI